MGQVARRVVGAAVGAVLAAGVGVAVLAPLHNSAPLKSAAATPSSAVANAGVGGSASAGASGGVGTAIPAREAAGPAVGPLTGGATAPAPSSSGTVSGAASGAVSDNVVRTGSLDVEVAKGGFAKAFSSAAEMAQAAGGFIVSADMGAGDDVPSPVEPLPYGVGPTISSAPASGATSALPDVSTSSGPGGPTWGTLVLRVPSARFDTVRRNLEGLGTLQNEQLEGEDAGGELADLGAQVTDLRAQLAGLRVLAAKATDTNDALAVQSQLASVQQQLDGLTSQQATLADQAALATITATISEPVPAAAAPATPSVLARRWAEAGHAVTAVIGGMLVVVAYAAPILALLGLAGGALLGVRRRRGSRSTPAVTT